jgi:hypothetical protein
VDREVGAAARGDRREAMDRAAQEPELLKPGTAPL